MVESHKFCVMRISSLSGVVFYSDTKGGHPRELLKVFSALSQSPLR